MNTTDDQMLRQQFAYTPSIMPTEYVNHGKQRARDEFASKLLEYMMRPGYQDRHTVIKIVDSEQLGVSPYGETIIYYTIDAIVSEARQQHVVIPTIPKYSEMSFGALSWTAVGDIKRRIHKFFNTQRMGKG